MIGVLQLLGFAGTLLVAIAYLPQILHLVREHCSAGISIRAWLLWLAAGLLILPHAIELLDPVFIVLQSVSILSIVVVILFAEKYKTSVCKIHMQR